MLAGAVGTAGCRGPEPPRCAAAWGQGPAVLLINSVTLGKLLGSFKFQLLNIGGND